MNEIDMKARDYVTTRFGEQWAKGNSTMQETITLEFEFQECCDMFQEWLIKSSGSHNVLESYKYNRFIRLRRKAIGELSLYTAFNAIN